MLASIGEFGINVVLALVVVAAAHYTLKLEAYQDLIIGMLLYVCVSATLSNRRLARANEADGALLARSEIWDKIAADTNLLATMRTDEEMMTAKLRELDDALGLIVNKYPTNGHLFSHWYRAKLEDVLQHTKHTIESDSYFFDTSLLEQQDRIYSHVFQARANDFFWCTATIKGLEWYLTPAGATFVAGIDAKVEQGLMKGLKRLFVYDTDTELGSFEARLCFLLHENSGYSFKLISSSDFNSILWGFQDSSLVPDFGIYGDHFVWETQQDATVMIEHGQVCVGSERLTRYSQLFEKLWGQAVPAPAVVGEFAKQYGATRMAAYRPLVLAERRNRSLAAASAGEPLVGPVRGRRRTARSRPAGPPPADGQS